MNFKSKVGETRKSAFVERGWDAQEKARRSFLWGDGYSRRLEEWIVVQLLRCIRLFATPWTVAHQASLSFTISWSLFKHMSTESVMPSNHLILCRPFCLQSFPVSGSFLMNQLFTSGDQSIGASASVLPMNIQD